MKQMLWGNPVLLRELQERVLSRRTMIMVTVWAGLLCLVTALYYIGETSNNFGNQFDPFGNSILRVASIGQNMFDWLLFAMIGLVLFLVPGFTAASIAGERERQTLLPMQVTLLRPIDIVIGKVLASVVFVLVLIALATPVLAFAYVIGGITIGEVFISLAMLSFSALGIACLTVACSAIVRRVPAAIVTAYGVVLLLTIGSLVAYGVAYAVDDSRGFDRPNPPLEILAANPVVALADVGDKGTGTNNFFGDTETPMGVLRELLRDNEQNSQPNDIFFEPDLPVIIGPDGFPAGQALPVPIPPPNFDGVGFVNQPVSTGMPFWLRHVIAMTALSVLAVWLAARRITTPAKVER